LETIYKNENEITKPQISNYNASKVIVFF